MSVDIRERTRDAVRGQLAELAFNYFLANGFDESTVDEAAKAAGISRATYFRYFSTKEDAVIVAMQSSDLDYGAVLRDLELRPDESWLALLRRVFEPTVEATELNPARVRAKVSMITAIPSLRAHLLERRRVQEDHLIATVSERLADALTAKVLVVAALAVVDLAWREWAADPEASFRELLDGAFTRLAD